MSTNRVAACLKVSFLLSAMLFLQVARAQYDLSAIDQKMEAAKKELDGNAFLLVSKDGKVIYQKVLGEVNGKTQVPISYASQWLTVALVMTFVDEGKISLDDRVSKYMPVFTKYSKGYITIRHCLSHLTGIESDPVRSYSALGKRKYGSLDEEVNDFAAKKEIESNPGLEFRYDNTGLNIAARVLELITRRSFDQLMQQRITRPLMMRTTNFTSTGLGAPNPSAGAASSPLDYTNFLTMLLSKGSFNGKQILSEKSVAEMLTGVTTPAMIKYAPKGTAGYNYGLGAWIMQADENGQATVAAAPGMFGAWPMLDRCRGYSFVLFTDGKQAEEKKDLIMAIKEIIDSKIPSTCK